MAFRSYLKQTVRKLRSGAERKATKMANAIRNQVIIGMTEPKTGNVYKVPGTGRTYTASAPGEYPAIRTGQLRANVKLAVQVSFRGVYGIVGTNIKHGLILEGTDSKPGIRPWLSKGTKEAKAELDRIRKEPLF